MTARRSSSTGRLALPRVDAGEPEERVGWRSTQAATESLVSGGMPVADSASQPAARPSRRRCGTRRPSRRRADGDLRAEVALGRLGSWPQRSTSPSSVDGWTWTSIAWVTLVACRTSGCSACTACSRGCGPRGSCRDRWRGTASDSISSSIRRRRRRCCRGRGRSACACPRRAGSARSARVWPRPRDELSDRHADAGPRPGGRGRFQDVC